MNDQSDNKITNPRQFNEGDSFTEICQRRLSRRDLLKSGIAVGVATAVGGVAGCANQFNAELEPRDEDVNANKNTPYQSNYDFIEIEHGIDEHHHVAADHQAQILLRWGDPIFKDAPEFDPYRQTAEKQLQQFGFNNDYIGYISLQPLAGQDERALLCVNHEYPGHGLMFPNFGSADSISEEQVKISKAASGNSIIEISRKGNQWTLQRDSHYNRRLNALETEFEISGPVAGNPRLSTSADSHARTVIGTINNCAGGITPWGTYLSCEENFNYCFSGELAPNHPEAANHKRYNVPTDLMYWGKFDKRFDLSVEPNEANRFGWVVEIDPLDPQSKPKKRTAMGRFKHEGGENIIAADGRLVVYMGDDQKFEYLYKFVSRDKVDLVDREANRDLLDQGTLYVARFFDDGNLEWLPLEYQNEVLQAQFASQADILIEARRAADLLGATPMDRPEDVVPNSKTGKVYVMLTNNNKRKTPNAANPRTSNKFGHIIEISELDNNHAQTRGHWQLVVLCGDPQNPAHNAKWNHNTSANGWFTSPDNGAVDPAGRLWVATDQGEKVSLSGSADGLWALETEGVNRGTGKMFFRVPSGAELCGPIFSDNGESLFLSVQHPGDISEKSGAARYDTATTLWPDFKEGTPPKPSLMVIRRKGGGRVG